MSHRITTHYVGLDVHKDSITVAVAEAGRDPARVAATVPHEMNALAKVLERGSARGRASAAATRPGRPATAWPGSSPPPAGTAT